MEEGSSGATSVQVEIVTENCSGENTESRSIHTPEENTRNNSGVPDEEILEDQRNSIAETLAQEAMITTEAQADEDYLPETDLSKVEDMNPPSASPDPPTTKDAPSEPCWYCLRSLVAESVPKVTNEENFDAELPLPSSGQKINYQTDPRPHFGVACSSHSTCHPLWGSEGPCWGQRNQEADQIDTCPHCHLGLTPDTLRWHEAKCLLFEELRCSKKEN